VDVVEWKPLWWSGSRCGECGGVGAVAVDVVEWKPLRWMWWRGRLCGGCGVVFIVVSVFSQGFP